MPLAVRVAMHALTEFRQLAALLVVKDSPMPTADAMLWHIRELYREIPGLALTVGDVREAFQSDERTCDAVLKALVNARFLRIEDERLVAGR